MVRRTIQPRRCKAAARGEPKDREVAQALFLTSLCCECDSEHCVFNPDGICKAPFVTGRAPGLNDDGCTDYCYKEAE